ncbi:MAG: hypothetical protein AB8U66_06535 [Rickettsiales endosymbiont of Dermacentor nuttalli]
METLNLYKPIYKKTAVYGYFGQENHDFSWKQTHKAELLHIYI